MFRKSKIEPVEKVKIVEYRRNGKQGKNWELIIIVFVFYLSVWTNWILNQPKNKSYSKDLKYLLQMIILTEKDLQDILQNGIRFSALGV